MVAKGEGGLSAFAKRAKHRGIRIIGEEHGADRAFCTEIQFFATLAEWMRALYVYVDVLALVSPSEANAGDVFSKLRGYLVAVEYVGCISPEHRAAVVLPAAYTLSGFIRNFRAVYENEELVLVSGKISVVEIVQLIRVIRQSR